MRLPVGRRRHVATDLVGPCHHRLLASRLISSVRPFSGAAGRVFLALSVRVSGTFPFSDAIL